jgi:hypothetical protein
MNSYGDIIYVRKNDITCNMIIAANGEKSIPPVAGRIRLIGDKIGSVI